MKHKKILIVVVAIVLIVLVLNAIGSRLPHPEPNPSDPPAPSASEPAPEPTPSADPAPETPEPTPVINLLMEAEFKTADVLNGFNTDKIGEYGYIELQKSDMATVTGDQLVEFCESKVDGSGLNWVWIMFEDGTGIHIIDAVWTIQMEYGTTNAKDRSFSALGSIDRVQENGEMLNEFTYTSYKEKQEIQAAVEAVIPDNYKGLSYSCDVLTRSDGSGYIVSLQIDVDVVPPESTEIISSLEEAINGLGYDRVVEIQIMAYKTTQKEMGLVDSNMDLDPSLYKIPAE